MIEDDVGEGGMAREKSEDIKRVKEEKDKEL